MKWPTSESWLDNEKQRNFLIRARDFRQHISHCLLQFW